MMTAAQKHSAITEMERRRNHRLIEPELSQVNRTVIAEAISSLPEDERKDTFLITSEVGNVLAKRYGTKDKETGEYVLTDGAEYQLKRTGMSTTYDIIDKVQIFLSRYSISSARN